MYYLVVVNSIKEIASNLTTTSTLALSRHGVQVRRVLVLKEANKNGVRISNGGLRIYSKYISSSKTYVPAGHRR